VLGALTLQDPDGQWTLLLPLQLKPGSVDMARVQAAVAGLPQTQVLHLSGELGRMYSRYLNEARVQAALGGLGVLLVMAFVLRKPGRLLAVSQPILLAVLLCLGGLALLQIPMGILHLVGLLLVVAVGSNYALFFDMLQHGGGEADDDTLASLLLANLTTVLGFGLIALSDIKALSAIGSVVAPGALLALVLNRSHCHDHGLRTGRRSSSAVCPACRAALGLCGASTCAQHACRTALALAACAAREPWLAHRGGRGSRSIAGDGKLGAECGRGQSFGPDCSWPLAPQHAARPQRQALAGSRHRAPAVCAHGRRRP
jgi:hypothetical protein